MAPSLFGRIGSLVLRRSRAVLLVSLLVFLVGAGLGFTAFGKLKTGRFSDPNSGSAPRRAAPRPPRRSGRGGMPSSRLLFLEVEELESLRHERVVILEDAAVAGVVVEHKFAVR